MTDIVWPYHILAPRTVTPEPAYATMGGGRSLTAVEQVVASDAGYWAISYDGVPIASGLHKKAWRAISARAEGRLNPILVPTYDTDTNPWPLVNGAPFTAYPDGVPHSDDTLFSDDTGYAQPVIVATVDADVALGANSMVIDLVQGSALEPGQHYSVGVRLFRIKRITAVAGSLYTVTVWPPTREAITAGAIAEFDRPICKCRLATDGEMQSGKDDYAGRTLATVNFVEYLP